MNFKYSLECKYCGHKWLSMYKTVKCIKCSDKNIKARSVEKSNIFGYDESLEDLLDEYEE